MQILNINTGYKIVEKKETKVLIKTIKQCKTIRNAFTIMNFDDSVDESRMIQMMNEQIMKKMIKEYTLSQKEANKYILTHFTSYDGFISFISNDINIWKQTDIKDYKEKDIIALLDMLIILSNEENSNNLNEDTYYAIDKYNYAIPYCYIKGKKYDMYTYIDKVIKIIKSKYPLQAGSIPASYSLF